MQISVAILVESPLRQSRFIQPVHPDLGGKCTKCFQGNVFPLPWALLRACIRILIDLIPVFFWFLRVEEGVSFEAQDAEFTAKVFMRGGRNLLGGERREARAGVEGIGEGRGWLVQGGGGEGSWWRMREW